MEERLLNYNKLIADIKELKWKIKRLENKEVQASSPTLEVTGIKTQGYKSSSLENEVVKKVDSIELLKKELEEKEMEKEYIDAKLNILKPIERRAIELKFFKKLSDEAIQATINRDAQSTISRLIKRALNKMQ